MVILPGPVTADADLVAVRVMEIRAVVVWMIVRPKAWRPVALSAGRERDGMALINDISAVRQ